MPSQFFSQVRIGFAKTGVFTPSNKRLLAQLLAVAGLLFLSRLGEHIPLPGLEQRLVTDLFGRQSGANQVGAAVRVSLFALGIWPYIWASLYMQLAIWAFPRVAALTETARGRRHLNTYIRFLAVLVAVAYAYSIATGLEKVWIGRAAEAEMASWVFHLSTILSMTAGSMFLVWLSDEITRRGLGDGVLLILFAEFVGSAPQAIVGGFHVYQIGILTDQRLAGLIFLMAAVLCAVVVVESGRRYFVAEQEERSEDDIEPGRVVELPALKLNPAGVAAPLLAAALVLLALAPVLISAEVWDSERLRALVASSDFGQQVRILLYGIAIACVTYILSVTAVNSREATSDESLRACIDHAQRRLAAFNAFYLAVLCLLPEAFILYFQLPFSYGGETLLTAVLVCLNIIRAFEREWRTAPAAPFDASALAAASPAQE